MAKGVFITGTGTGVGKTMVAAVIIRGLISRGVKTGAMKPVETGCARSAGGLVPSDGLFLREAAEMDDTIDLVAPVRFRYPLAPMVASGLEKRPAALDMVFYAYAELSGKYDYMVVEGAGGLLAPIKDIPPQPPAKGGIRGVASTYFMADLIGDLGLPAVIVTGAGLGTINHTLLTVDYALRRGIRVLGVIINHTSPPGKGIAEKTNPEALRKLCPVPVIGIVPHMKKLAMKDIQKASSSLDFDALSL